MNKSVIYDETKELKALRFFRNFPLWALWFFAIGIVGIIIAKKLDVLNTTWLYVVGVIAIIIGITAIVMYFSNRTSNEEMDRFLKEDLGKLNKWVQSKLDINNKLVAPTIILYGYYDKNNEFFKECSDDKIRFMPIDSVFINFTDTQVLTYRIVFWLGGEIDKESSDEIFYKDIVSVKTENRKVGMLDDIPIAEFKLTTTGGTSISQRTFDLKAAEQAVQTIRNLLRTWKK